MVWYDMYVGIYVRTDGRTQVCRYVGTQVCRYVCMYVIRMYACMYVHKTNVKVETNDNDMD